MTPVRQVCCICRKRAELSYQIPLQARYPEHHNQSKQQDGQLRWLAVLEWHLLWCSRLAWDKIQHWIEWWCLLRTKDNEDAIAWLVQWLHCSVAMSIVPWRCKTCIQFGCVGFIACFARWIDWSRSTNNELNQSRSQLREIGLFCLFVWLIVVCL